MQGRTFSDEFTLPDGRKIGWRFKERNGTFRVFMKHPTDDKYLEISTGQSTRANALGEVERIILTAYGHAKGKDPRKVTWQEAADELKALNLKPKTLEAYQGAINTFRLILPTVRGPMDVNVHHVEKFKALALAQPYHRGKSTIQRYRGKTAVNTHMRMFKQLYNGQFRALGFVQSNPWKEVKPPKPDKAAVRIPSEEQISSFFKWVETKYPGWELMQVFLSIKAVSGCRLNDLCQVKAFHFDPKAATLTIPATADKTHQERILPLPASIVKRLKAIQGKDYLWDRYVQDARKYRKGPKNLDHFKPSALHSCVGKIFEFSSSKRAAVYPGV